MKRNFFFFIFFSFITFSAVAQTAVKTISLGGGIRYTHSSDENNFETVSDFHLRPMIGYFVSDKLELGLAIDLGIGKGIMDDDEFFIVKGKSMLLGPFAKYYIQTAVSNFYFTFKGQASVTFWSRKIKLENFNETETRSESFGLSLSPGFTYFFTEKWGLDFQFQGISFSQDPYLDLTQRGVDESAQFEFNFSLDPALGFRYFINR